MASLNDDGDHDATYDARDRLLSQGSATFTWAPTGELQTKTESGATTTYSYDALGNLKAVELGDGTVVEYKVDAQGRRVQRLLDGVSERGWIWRSALQPAAQLSSGGAVTQRYVYTNGTSPALIVTPGASYRLIKDHLGSVRRVVDTATGQAVHTLDYDAWGRVLVDSNPGFQPFGYAGGLYGADTGLVRLRGEGLRPRDRQVAHPRAPRLRRRGQLLRLRRGQPRRVQRPHRPRPEPRRAPPSSRSCSASAPRPR